MHDKMTIGDLILLAGGIRNKVKFVKIELSRYDEYEDLTNIITMNYMNTFEQLNSNNKSLNYLLENNDLVNIYSMDKSPFKSVSINGEISFPGQYVLVDEGNDIHSIIKRAGLTDVANSSFATVVRGDKVINLNLIKALKSKRNKHNIALMDGDSIKIEKKTNTISVLGAVNTPGIYQYIKGYKVKDYIELAGGYTKQADKYSTYVTHLNGSSEKTRILKPSANVYDSSVIR